MSRKNNEHQSLKEVLGDFVQDHNLSKGLDKVEVKDLWFELMGKGVGNYTNNGEKSKSNYSKRLL